MNISSASAGHNYNHLARLSATHQVISHTLHLPFICPGALIVCETMKQVKHGISLLRVSIKTVRKINAKRNFAIKHFTLERVINDNTRHTHLCESKRQDARCHKAL